MTKAKSTRQAAASQHVGLAHAGQGYTGNPAAKSPLTAIFKTHAGWKVRAVKAISEDLRERAVVAVVSEGGRRE